MFLEGLMSEADDERQLKLERIRGLEELLSQAEAERRLLQSERDLLQSERDQTRNAAAAVS